MIKTELDWVFHRTQLERRVYAKSTRALYRTGGYALKVMRSLFKTRKKSSLPGDPPHSHGQKLLKRASKFAVDRDKLFVVAGPMKLNGTASVKSRKPAPSLLEEGGSAQIEVRGRWKKARYRARPFVERTRARTIPRMMDIIKSDGLV